MSVSVDDELGIGLSVDRLVDLGHTRIGYVAGPRDADTARRRRAGFCARMRERGLEVRPSMIVETTFTEAGGFEAMQRLLAMRRRPTAVVAASFASAVGVMSAVATAGLRVPDDVSVVGFHDAPVAAYLNPPLSTVRMPLAEMAEAAVATLVRLIDGQEVEDIVVRSPGAGTHRARLDRPRRRLIRPAIASSRSRLPPITASTSAGSQTDSRRVSAACANETKSSAGEKSEPHSSRDGPNASRITSTNGCAARWGKSCSGSEMPYRPGELHGDVVPGRKCQQRREQFARLRSFGVCGELPR